MSLQESNWDALLSLHPGFVETVARRVLQLAATLDDAPQRQAEDLLTVAQVAARLRVNPRWVYAHQAELGAIRLGPGPKARLRFDPHAVEANLLSHAAGPGAIAVMRASAPTSRRRRRLQSRPLPALDRIARDRWLHAMAGAGPRRKTRKTKPPAAERRAGRPAKGGVVTWTRQNGDVGYGVRFTDQHGERQYERCGLASEGWSLTRAQIELANFEQLVRAGVYEPTPDIVPVEDRDPVFAPFARAFLAEHAVETASNTRELNRGLLHNHLMPYLGALRLSQITWSVIDSYKKQRLMLAQRISAASASGTPLRDQDNRPLRLSERTINMSIGLLAMVLDEAVRRPDLHLSANVARDKKLKVKVPKKAARDWLEPEEVLCLLEAGELMDNPVRPETVRKAAEVRRLRDVEHLTNKQAAAVLGISEAGAAWLYYRRATRTTSQRRAIIAVLTASGTRNTELCRLRWQDIDFAGSKIRIRAAKTPAGIREIDMTPWLREQLLAHKASLVAPDQTAPVFPTRAGTFRNKDNLNHRVIAPVQRAAAKLRTERGLAPLPTRLSAHVFRRTYATLMAEAGAPPKYVQIQLGHESTRLTLDVYTRVSESRDRRKVACAFDELMAGAIPHQADPARQRPADDLLAPALDQTVSSPAEQLGVLAATCWPSVGDSASERTATSRQ
jgi:integrase